MPLTTRRRGAPFSPSITLSLSNLGLNSHPNPTHPTTKPILFALWLTPPPLPEAFPITPTRFNLHKYIPTGGFLQTVVSDAPAPHPEPTCILAMGRIRYNTSVSGSLPNSQAALRPPGPLGTGREGVPSPSSSPSNASLEETRFRNGKTLTMNPVMAGYVSLAYFLPQNRCKVVSPRPHCVCSIR